MTIDNGDFLVRVQAMDKEQLRFVTYRKRSWFRRVEGFYGDFGGDYFTPSDERHIVQDHKVYYLPKVVLSFADGSKKEIKRQTFAEAKSLAESIAEKFIKTQIVYGERD